MTYRLYYTYSQLTAVVNVVALNVVIRLYVHVVHQLQYDRKSNKSLAERKSIARIIFLYAETPIQKVKEKKQKIPCYTFFDSRVAVTLTELSQADEGRGSGVRTPPLKLNDTLTAAEMLFVVLLI